MLTKRYRGRLAPSPTGLLHLGHARTFWAAYTRACNAGGTLVFRNEDLDPQRSRGAFAAAMVEDLDWLGIHWQEGPEPGSGRERGEYGPYTQSQRGHLYRDAWAKLLAGGRLYPCACSRKELAQAAQAPHENDEPLYPGTCRRQLSGKEAAEMAAEFSASGRVPAHNWRFRVPKGECIHFDDRNPAFGPQAFEAGRDFSDFVVWRRDGVPAYQLAVVVDDAAMEITEVVRGADLLLSTARQILLQRALGLPAVDYFHCELLTDTAGERLAKRHDALSLRALREQGMTPEDVLQMAGVRERNVMDRRL